MEESSAAHLAMSILRNRRARRIEPVYNLGIACCYVAQGGDAPESTVLASFLINDGDTHGSHSIEVSPEQPATSDTEMTTHSSRRRNSFTLINFTTSQLHVWFQRLPYLDCPECTEGFR